MHSLKQLLNVYELQRANKLNDKLLRAILFIGKSTTTRIDDLRKIGLMKENQDELRYISSRVQSKKFLFSSPSGKRGRLVALTPTGLALLKQLSPDKSKKAYHSYYLQMEKVHKIAQDNFMSPKLMQTLLFLGCKDHPVVQDLRDYGLLKPNADELRCIARNFKLFFTSRAGGEVGRIIELTEKGINVLNQLTAYN